MSANSNADRSERICNEQSYVSPQIADVTIRQAYIYDIAWRALVALVANTLAKLLTSLGSRRFLFIDIVLF